MAKATAVRNIRDDHQKAFLKIFNSLCGRFNRWQVWQDFVMVTAIEISNATDKQNAPERTKTYQTIISKYSDAEQNKFAELLAEVIMGMEQNPDQDFLGELYMLCELGNDASGQFFTPYDVCNGSVESSANSYAFFAAPSSASFISLTIPIAVGPDMAPTRTVTLSVSSFLSHPAKSAQNIERASNKANTFFTAGLFFAFRLISFIDLLSFKLTL